MQQPLTTKSSVSIVIPAYNSCEFLSAAIESVLAQTYPASEIEIVVVDDGSTDNTKAVCDRYPTVKYIYQTNQGLPGARNKGIEVSHCSLLIFLDSDDCLLPDAVEIGVNCLQAHPEAGFVFGRYVFKAINPDGSYTVQKLFDEPPPIASYATILAAEHNLQCATAICRREAIAAIGGGFAPHQEDMNLFLRLARQYPIFFHDRVVSEYRYHGSNESSKSGKMLAATMRTHGLEAEYVRQTGNLELMAAYETGRSAWIKFYGDRLIFEAIRSIQAGEWIEAIGKLRIIINYDPQLQSIDREAHTAATTDLATYLQKPADLPLFVEIDRGQIKDWGYNPELFDPATIDRLDRDVRALLANIGMLIPDRTEPPALSNLQAQQILFAWNDTNTDYPRDRCIHQIFEQQVADRGDAIALVYQQQQLTYAQLNHRANQLAHHLLEIGIQPEDLVAIALDRSLDTIITILAILKAGGGYLPLDSSQPLSRLAFIIENAGVSRLITKTALLDRLPAHTAQIINLDTAAVEIEDRPTTDPQIVLAADNLAYVMYTSGSTGNPKGVCIPHRGVVRLVKSTNYLDFSPQQVFLQLAPLGFDASTFEIWGSLLNGAKLVLFPAEKPSLAQLGDIVNREGITTLLLTTGLFHLMVDERLADLKPLRQLLAGGDVLSVTHVQKVLSVLTNCQLINAYGPTENTTIACCYQISRTDPDLRSIPIGKPIANTQVYILDADLQPVPIGVEGELHIGGDGLARGYLHRQDLDAQKFIAHPLAEVGRLYKTGDRARYLPDGNIEFLGRIDNQVKIRGFRIELGEVEATLAMHPGVREAIAILREDRPGDKRLVAYVVPDPIAPVEISQLRQDLQQQLPEYAIPAAFVYVAAMPLTANGKVDRKALPLPNLVNCRSTKIAIDNSRSERLRQRTERVVMEIWQEVLRIETIDLDDNFFDLGGNSLLGLKAIERIQQRCDLQLSVVRLYQYATIRSMAKHVTESLGGNAIQANIDRTRPQLPVANNGVAVIGMVGRFPGANSITEFWENLCAGRESISFFDLDEIDPSVDPELLADPHYVRAKGVMAGAEFFDASFFGMGAREAEMMDPQARILMELASAALETVGYTAVDNNKIGVYAGSADNTYFEKHLSCQAAVLDRFGEFQTHLVNDRDYFTTRASYKLNLQGPSINVSTACSTSLVAIIQAYQGLLNGQCDLALAGGVAISTPQNQGYLHQEGSIFTPDGHCRPFDAQAQGTSFNNGAGLVVLKRLDEAIAAGDRIYTVIKGVGMNNDGADKVSFTAPSVKGQMKAILQAQQSAGVHPESISYIEAHGTATALGDPIEVEALTQAFRTNTLAQQYCGIGSIKSNLGHLTAAAGVAGFIKTVLALYHRQIPPSINFDRPNPHIDFADSPFYVNDKLVDWPSGDTPRRAGVSSFGGGGTNAHVILEEPPQVADSSPSRPYQLLLLSAKTATALERVTSDLQQHLCQHPDLNLADVAFTLQQGRNGFNYRRAIVCQNTAEAIEHLATLPHLSTATRQVSTKNPGVVFVFPGQGSQYVNMGRELYQSEPVFQQAIDTCAEILQPLLERDLREIMYPATADLATNTELLTQTRYAQPALFAIEYALTQLWQSWGIKPVAAIGHSIGEFVAACLAGVFSLADALKLVAMRGKLMWDLPAGSMLSVRLPAAEVASRLTHEISIAAINSPAACVVSGSTDAIADLQRELEAAEVVCKRLHTSHAFHSPMMEAIVDPFAKLVAQIPLSPPQLPFISSVTADWITTEQATDPQYWANHLRQPVRFADGIHRIWQQDENYVLLEVGPRQALTILARQQSDRDRQLAIASLANSTTPEAEWPALLQAIGRLWLAGIDLDRSQFYARETRHRLPLPTYPFERQRFWIDPPPAPNFAPAVTQPLQTTTSHQPTIVPLVPQTSPTSEPRAVRLLPEIAAVFKDTAGVEIGTSERDATFLELGLDSLSLTQVALSLKKKFQVKVTFRQLLEDCSNLTSLAKSIDLQLPSAAFPAPIFADPTPVAELSVPNPSSPIFPTPAPPTAPISIQPLPPKLFIAGEQPTELAAIVQQQLQLMAQQLALLGGNAVASVSQVPTPAATPAPEPVKSASNGHGNGNGHHASTNGENQPMTTPQPDRSAIAGPSPGAKISKTIDNSLTVQQQQALADIIDRYVAKTPESKRQAQQHRRYLADPRTVSGFTPLLKEMVYPIVTDRAQGSRLWDEDGNEYIDLTNGFGLNFFGWSPDFVTDALKAQLDKGMAIGPQTPLAGKVAKKIAQFTGMERVAFCNTGSEAVMAALRIARTVTGKDLVVIFAGSYHGTFDEVLFRVGPNLKTFPSAPGVMASALENILVLDYDSPRSLEIIAEYADRLAAVIVEPVQSRHPQLQPQAFLHELRVLTERSEIALIIDEVITGFRVAPGGAQEHFGVKADIATYGKVVGGGMPIGILTGAAKYLDALDGGFWQFGDRSIPEIGVTFFAGTFVRHPLALAAVDAILDRLQAGGSELQQSLTTKTQQLVDRLVAHFKLVGVQIKIEHFSSLFYLMFAPTENYGGLLFYLLRERGIHIWENRPCFLTLAHSDADIETIIWAFQVCIAELQASGFLASSANAIAINRNLPPQPGAKLGKDRAGNPAWFVTDPQRDGKHLQIGTSIP
jgi:amino acid adenylation domain-containing protein